MCKRRFVIMWVALLSLATSLVAIAQVQPPDSNSLMPGAWGLQFGIGSSFTLTSFQGSTLGIKYHFSESNAIRMSISLDGRFNDQTGFDNQTTYDTSRILSSSDNPYRSAGVSLVAQYLWYLNPKGVVHAYIGLGPSVTYNYSQSFGDLQTLNYIQPSSPTGNSWATTHSEYTSHLWGVGARGAFGVEWFAVRWLSLRAEYSEDLQYQWNWAKDVQNQSNAIPPTVSYSFTRDSESSTKGWIMRSLGANLGLTVYF